MQKMLLSQQSSHLALCFDIWCYSPYLLTFLLEGTHSILFHLQGSLQPLSAVPTSSESINTFGLSYLFFTDIYKHFTSLILHVFQCNSIFLHTFFCESLTVDAVWLLANLSSDFRTTIPLSSYNQTKQSKPNQVKDHSQNPQIWTSFFYYYLLKLKPK